MPTSSDATAPLWVSRYGKLGLIPFLAPGLVGLVWPVAAPAAGTVLAAYAALILSFLGGARWGIAVTAPTVDNRAVSLAMLPSLIGLALLVLPAEWRGWQLAGLGTAHMLQGLWDVRATAVPVWYANLRGQLTLGAILGLALGIAVLRS